MGAFSNAGATLVTTLGSLYLLAVLLRFLLQVAKADFYNPLSQAIVRITNPLVKVFRAFVPGYRGIDFSCLALAVLVEIILTLALITIMGPPMSSFIAVIGWSVVGVLFFTLYIYYYAIWAAVILSLIMMVSGSTSPHPILQLVWQLTEPLLAPVRKVLPAFGGLDFSPLIVLLLMNFVLEILYATLSVTGAVARVVVGL